MSDAGTESKSAQLESEVRDMKLEAESPVEPGGADPETESQDLGKQQPASTGSPSPPKPPATSRTQSPAIMEKLSRSFSEDAGREEMVGGDITVKLEPGKAPKLSRSISQKIVSRPPPLFSHYEDKTQEAMGSFDVIADCTYGNKYMGSTEHALECDCVEEWDSEAKTNMACGEDSDCINRATKMECAGDCGCGPKCQNQRFLRKQYANVTVIKTEQKGYGLRANTDLYPNDFIFEYIGEVINEGAFRRRMIQYDEEGIKHFYFMSLSKGEFVDATKKGNLGRFCNHSCNPNCYVDKWVVGDKLRMGIFAERNIKAGEELVFNYNVDRYGADPQPCYCGEPNCTGYIGGKTQTERATKLSLTTIEALGIDDSDGWDTAVAKKPRKKKVSEDDEEYVNNVEPKSLDEGGVTKVMATLMQCKEKWIAVKLLSRIQRCDDERARNRVIKMHGYQILKTTLTTFMDDHNVALQILDVLDRMPRLSRNKIQNSNIEETIETLKHCGDERVEGKASRLLYEWSQLKMEYRIPRVKRDPNAVVETNRRIERDDRPQRDRSKSRSRSKSVEAPRGPSGRPGNLPARPFPPPRSFRRAPQFNPLPPGWFMAQDQTNGRAYYYSASGETTWQRPTVPAAQPPPPPKEKTNEQKLQDIIRSITENATPKTQTPTSTTPQPTFDSAQKEKKSGTEKWRTYPEEKQKKLYENTIFPHIRYVLDKFKHKLPKDDLKRFAKEISKKLVNSDFKNGRVQDPTKISEKQEKGVKKYCKEYLDKAVMKKKEHEKKRAERKTREGGAEASGTTTPPGDPTIKSEVKPAADDEMADISDDEMDNARGSLPSVSPEDQGEGATKRKREPETPNGVSVEGEDSSSAKKLKTALPPPPPPPPPTDGTTFDEDGNAIENSELAGSAAGSDSFTQEAAQAVQDASEGISTDAQLQNEKSIQLNRAVKVSGEEFPGADGHPSPMQLATPSTTSSYDGGDKRFEGMNPERLRQLGIANGR